MKAVIKSLFRVKYSTATKYVEYPSLLQYVAYPLMKFEPIDPNEFPEIWDQRRYLAGMKLFGIIYLGKQYIGIEKIKVDDDKEYKLRDNGSGELIKVWDHLITIKKVEENLVSYTDEINIKAGMLTPLIWAYAMLFYRWRQLRWEKLISTNFEALEK